MSCPARRSTISWNLVAAYYDALPYAKCALMNAEWPWSGSYEVAGPVWVAAHTTQFAAPGWYYLQHAAGVDLLARGGSFVALRSQSHSQSQSQPDFSLVIETMVPCVMYCSGTIVYLLYVCVYGYTRTGAQLRLTSSPAHVPPASQSHDHSLCIRPDLPKYSVEPQLANFSLGGQLVFLYSILFYS